MFRQPQLCLEALRLGTLFDGSTNVPTFEITVCVKIFLRCDVAWVVEGGRDLLENCQKATRHKGTLLPNSRHWSETANGCTKVGTTPARVCSQSACAPFAL